LRETLSPWLVPGARLCYGSEMAIEFVIAGASGVVGRCVVPRLLADARVGRVVALGRRALPETHPRLVSAVVDLRKPEALAREIPEQASVAVCCVGTTMKQAGSQAAFRAVDFDAVVAFAEAARRRGVGHCLVVSSIGADARARNFYLRTKGEAEQALGALGFAHLTILRPSMIDDGGTRQEHRTAERLVLPVARALFAVLGRERRYAPIRAETIAAALVRLSFEPGDLRIRIVESDELHRLGRQREIHT
jgi:uncharacterized protein YbjT (DUF2867 family)